MTSVNITSMPRGSFSQHLAHSLSQHMRLFQALPDSLVAIAEAGERLHSCIRAGGKILLCGNGGSAADAQHAATELVVRYQANRPALAAIALTTDTSILTACSNDFGFDAVFARQIAALGQPGDCLIAISTSGNSPSILHAAQTSRQQGLTVIGLAGHDGGQLAHYCDLAIIAPSTTTARIQEAHIFILHCWCEWLEAQSTAQS